MVPSDGSMQGDAAAPVKRVFVTEEQVSGIFGNDIPGGNNLEEANDLCTASATKAGLTGAWKAWLSTSNIDAIDNVLGAGPWHDTRGNVVFPDRASLLTGPAAGGIRFTAAGELLSDVTGVTFSKVWTGTGVDGREKPPTGSRTCYDWYGEGTGYGLDGNPYASGPEWTDSAGVPCTTPYHHLYCFEQ